MVNIVQELVGCLHPHYVINVLLSVSFYVLKVTPPACSMLFENCQLELREMEMLTFLACIVVLKNRKQQSLKSYVSTVCAFTKALSAFLFLSQSPLLGVVYILLCLVHIAFLPEPAYRGPDYITYFRTDNMEDEIKRDRRVTWLIEFYAAWQPACTTFAPVFAKLSADYSLDNLRFGKVDVTRNMELAERFRVNHTSWSKQLPTLMLFQGGKESMRRPAIDAKNRPLPGAKFVFTRENVVNAFQLNDVYYQCKKNPIKRRKDVQNSGGAVTSSAAADAVTDEEKKEQ